MDEISEPVQSAIQQFQVRMLRAAQQFARELQAAGEDAGMIGDITVVPIESGVTVHFWAAPTVEVTDTPAPDEANG